MSKYLRQSDGTLIIIGGHEDKTDGRVILKEVARRVGDAKLVITTVASRHPDGSYEEYARVFHDLGVRDVVELSVHERAEAREKQQLKALDHAGGLFFTGGDQLRITSQLGDTPLYSRIQELYDAGGVICGTSAGASVMSDVMLVSGDSGESHRIGELQMAPGFGLLRGVVIDQHFAERGRMGRLLGAVAKNPRYIGLGIDENTAVVVEGGTRLRVVGESAVYVLDGETVSRSNVAEARQDHILSIHDLTLHVLCDGEGYDLQARRPQPVEQPEEELPQAADE